MKAEIQSPLCWCWVAVKKCETWARGRLLVYLRKGAEGLMRAQLKLDTLILRAGAKVTVPFGSFSHCSSRMSVWLKTKQLDSWREFCPSFGPGTLFLVEGLGVVCGGGFCAQPPNRGWFKASSGQWLETYLHRVVEMYQNFQGGLKTHESIDCLEITGLSLLYSIDYHSQQRPLSPSSVREI